MVDVPAVRRKSDSYSLSDVKVRVSRRLHHQHQTGDLDFKQRPISLIGSICDPGLDPMRIRSRKTQETQVFRPNGERHFRAGRTTRWDGAIQFSKRRFHLLFARYSAVDEIHLTDELSHEKTFGPRIDLLGRADL